jgi:hypothetical protein
VPSCNFEYWIIENGCRRETCSFAKADECLRKNGTDITLLETKANAPRACPLRQFVPPEGRRDVGLKIKGQDQLEFSPSFALPFSADL